MQSNAGQVGLGLRVVVKYLWEEFDYIDSFKLLSRIFHFKYSLRSSHTSDFSTYIIFQARQENLGEGRQKKTDNTGNQMKQFQAIQFKTSQRKAM